MTTKEARATFSLRRTRHVPRAQKNWTVKKDEKLKLQRTYHRLANHERSISALKSAKTEIRSFIEKERLNSLMWLCAQNDITMMSLMILQPSKLEENLYCNSNYDRDSVT
ncbi:hypothetical protein TNCV_3600771 [Trichonephila clavipes]|nr:hypothetical protein TNCV_3600771 [Trichonephila clavipes]